MKSVSPVTTSESAWRQTHCAADAVNELASKKKGSKDSGEAVLQPQNCRSGGKQRCRRGRAAAKDLLFSVSAYPQKLD